MCCGEKMEEIVPNTTDASKEKHVPEVLKRKWKNYCYCWQYSTSND